ncbi:hypothetical protein [Hymenobacter jeollabukensis]|uniref:Anti-sigma factor n=1 Tax=Hymenobacter jeollabukensis TaxID=2025313 RepID=A0A5R8WMC3_9BACT|nr:hypothetical protein [Hymenobacter jeollabukensis]TLM90532.1 hypothetical protein FDY95_17610 [Hymenobacter jeollabukensis]
MKPNSGLEAFVERNRADFDAFEPRPDLWDALEARLDQPADADEASGATPTPVVPLHPFPAAPAPTQPQVTAPAASFGWQRYAAAAAVALLLVAGGYGLRRADETPGAVAATDTAAMTTLGGPSTSVSVMDEPEALAVSSNAAARRLEKAVKRMETYYAAQISEKKHELDLLDAAAPGTMPKDADWQQEMAAQDSTYRQLRADLFQNPDPNAVLDAMNQNLQIRLDILNQQLRTREQIRQYHDDAYTLAADK